MEGPLREFVIAVQNGDQTLVKKLLDDEFDTDTRWYGYKINFIALSKDIEMTKFLLNDSRLDPTVGRNCAINRAADENHPTIVELLLNDERVRNVGNFKDKVEEVIDKKDRELLTAAVFCCQNIGGAWPDLHWIIKNYVKWY